MDTELILQIIQRHRNRSGGIYSILRNIKRLCGYLSEDCLRTVAASTGCPLGDVCRIAKLLDFVNPRAAEDNKTIVTPWAHEQDGYFVVRCPACNHSLMDSDYRIDGLPSVRITASFGDRHGWFRFSARPNTYHVESEHELPGEGQIDFFCPRCNAELMEGSNCEECDAPLVPVMMHDVGMTKICSSSQCRARLLDQDEELVGSLVRHAVGA
jgi:hypothetical protein